MAKCLNVDCSNEVVSQEGKRQKKTCSDSCRQKVWQKNKQDKQFIKIPYEEWERLTTIENELLKRVIDKTINGVELMPLIKTTPYYENERIENERRPIGNKEQKLFLEELKKENKGEPIKQKSFTDWMSIAKNGVSDIESFKTSLTASNLNGNQKLMVLSKLNNQ